MFVPVEVAHEGQGKDLKIREVTSLEGLGEIHPITLLASTPSSEVQAERVEEDTLETAQEKPEESTELASSDPTPQVEREEEQKVEAPAEATTPVIPPVSSVSVTAPKATSSPRKSRSGCYIWLIVAMLLLIGAILVIFLLNNQQKNKNEAKPLPSKPTQQTTPTTVIPTSEPREKDSLMIQADSSIGTASDTLASTPAPTPPSTSKVQPTSCEETEVVRIQAGDRLTRFSLRKYGHKAFWVYIYEENRSRIKDPDNIPIGTTITLPQASKYKIDARDTNSVNRALILQRSIKNK